MKVDGACIACQGRGDGQGSSKTPVGSTPFLVKKNSGASAGRSRVKTACAATTTETAKATRSVAPFESDQVSPWTDAASAGGGGDACGRHGAIHAGRELQVQL